MTDIRTAGLEVEGQILDTVRKSQEVIVTALKAWADAVQSVTPAVPPTLSPSLSEKLPGPEELVANAYDFAQQLLASQRKFAEDVLQVTGSVLTTKKD